MNETTVTFPTAHTPWHLWVVAILAFVWLTPPAWINDPTAAGMGLWSLF